MPPKTAAEILASAKAPPKKAPRKPPSNLSAAFEPSLSTFSAKGASSSDPMEQEKELAEASAEPATETDISSKNLPFTFMPLSTELSYNVQTSIDTDQIYEDQIEELDSHSSSTESVSPMTHEQRISEILSLLRGGRLSPFDLALEILDKYKPQYHSYQVEFYKESSQKLFALLDQITSSQIGRKKLSTWIKAGPGLDLICEIISDEMDDVQKAEKLPGLASITPEFIKTWSISGHPDLAPCTIKILQSAAETSLAHEKNKLKTPDAVCNVIMKQLVYQRSFHSLGFQAQFGLFLWATGCARQTIEALHHCGLSVSYSSVLKTITALGNHCMQLAITASTVRHMMCYDNMNISTSPFTEQRGAGGPAKVTSGTFGIIYNVRNGVPEYMELAPIMERFRKTKGLDFNQDIRPTTVQLGSFKFQLRIIIIRVLVTYVKGFNSEYVKDVQLQHKPRHPIPIGYKTQQYPLCITTIEEASIDGNLLYHDEIYLNMLKHTTDSLSKYAIPSSNNQLTNSRIRSCFYNRNQDTNPWNRREVFQLGLGLFHLCLNLIWALLHIHRGSVDQTGSLTYFFKILDKTRLGCDHPDYHSLLAAFMQILDGLLLNAWRQECGKNSLASFAESKPTPDELLKVAEKILKNYVTSTTENKPSLSNVNNRDASVDCSESEADSDQDEVPRPSTIPNCCPVRDTTYGNIRLLTRDVLYVAELIRAISDGDIGRIEDFLPQLAMIFRGAGSNNYCTEILHFIHNLKHVWTPEFANIMRDNQLLNFTGLPGHSMPVDLNIEHLIGELKSLLTAKGLETTWDRLGDISAAIDYLNTVKKQVSSVMRLSHKNKGHSDVDTTHLVWKVANTAQEHKLQTLSVHRLENSRVNPVIDTLSVGEARIESASLATFNKRIQGMVEGRRTVEDDIDELPRNEVQFNPVDGGQSDE